MSVLYVWSVLKAVLEHFIKRLSVLYVFCVAFHLMGSTLKTLCKHILTHVVCCVMALKMCLMKC